jgi:hypothetical protein
LAQLAFTVRPGGDCGARIPTTPPKIASPLSTERPVVADVTNSCRSSGRSGVIATF